MLRAVDLVLIAIMIAAATFTYQVKHEAEEKAAEVKRLEAAIKLEENTIDLLKADWSLLNQPSRLQNLTQAFESHLQLTTTQARQLASPEELPGRAADFAPLTAQDPALSPDTTTMTGSVGN